MARIDSRKENPICIALEVEVVLEPEVGVVSRANRRSVGNGKVTPLYNAFKKRDTKMGDSASLSLLVLPFSLRDDGDSDGDSGGIKAPPRRGCLARLWWHGNFGIVSFVGAVTGKPCTFCSSKLHSNSNDTRVCSSGEV